MAARRGTTFQTHIMWLTQCQPCQKSPRTIVGDALFHPFMVIKRTIAAINRWYKASPTVYTVAAINGCIFSVVLYGSYRYYSPLWPGETPHSQHPTLQRRHQQKARHNLGRETPRLGAAKSDWLWFQQQTPQEMERYRRGIGEVSERYRRGSGEVAVINDGDFI